MLRLGYGCHRRLVWAALTEQTSAVGVDIACDKIVAKELLAGAGVPVPAGTVARTAAEAASAFARFGPSVVVKPRNGNHGGGITVGAAGRRSRRGVPPGQRDRAGRHRGTLRGRHRLPGARRSTAGWPPPRSCGPPR